MKNITFRTFYNFLCDQYIGGKKPALNIYLTPYMYKKYNNKRSTKVFDPNISSIMHLSLYDQTDKVVISGNSLYTKDWSMVKFIFSPKHNKVTIYPEKEGCTDIKHPIVLDIDTNIFDLESEWTTKLECNNTFNASEILAFLVLLLYDYAKEN